MARKPADVIAAAPKPSGREVVWRHIRLMAAGFTLRDLNRATDIPRDTIASYLQGLTAAGYLERTPRTDANEWRLIRDVGSEAPRVRPDGTPVTQGLAREQMWRTMKRLDGFSWRDLALAASTDSVPVADEDAKSYCHDLAVAGYLLEIVKGKGGGKAVSHPSRYRFNRAKNTGPRAPMVQRMKTIFDPNLGRVVWHPEVDA